MQRLKLILPFLITFSLLANQANSQVDRKYFNTKTKKEKVSPLWYGVAMNNIAFWGNTLALGASPMVGYKIIPQVTVGAIVKMSYIYTRNAAQFGYKSSRFDVGVGPFVRAKIFRGVYAHGEYEYTHYSQHPLSGIENIWEPHAYVGLGYNVGGNKTWSSDISALVNVLDKDGTAGSRFFDYRIAFTYNF